MDVWLTYGLRGWIATADRMLKHDNDNLRLLTGGLTAAEVMQWVKREKELMRRELEADFRLRSDPKHRQDWELLHGLEQCTREQCYGER